MDSQPKHPFTNAPGSEVQQMNYKDWMHMDTAGAPMALSTDPVNTVRDGVIITTGILWAILSVPFPVASSVAGIFNVLVPYLWPEGETPGTPQAQFTLEQLMSAVEGLVDERILASKRSDAVARWQGIQVLNADYTQTIADLKADPNNKIKKDRVRDAFDDLEDALKLAMPFFKAQGFEVPMLAMYAQAANMHLLLLRDVVQHGASWGFQQYEIERYYSNTSTLGNPGLIQLLSLYTEHCVSWYNTGLENNKATNQWHKFNDFRRDMTIMVLDFVSLWPTYNPRLYAKPTKSQLTRTVYQDRIGASDPEYPKTPIVDIETNGTVPPRLFTWLRQINAYVCKVTAYTGAVTDMLDGYKLILQTTLDNQLWETTLKGPGCGRIESITIPPATSNDDICRINTSLFYVEHPFWGRMLNELKFSFTKSEDQQIGNRLSGGIRTLNELPRHRFSYLGLGASNGITIALLGGVVYGWTHVSADPDNLIDPEKITQIPAVKASSLSENARVVKGPGSTGGDLVEIDRTGKINLNLTFSDTTKSYQVRFRWATISGSQSADTLRYNDFSYADFTILSPRSNRVNFPIELEDFDGKIVFDKIEFIPM
ncbi:insecticidal delta-endotoxin Cry8Ea1 family protein [Bacillus cereus group sp. IBL03679]|uniref:insecticidal delta-endotoxin Cry8Ea1 family protein n=1 Tax=Bacillus cereus group sp. IBL03679 TaxID=3240095 RepID=UPI003D2F6218